MTKICPVCKGTGYTEDSEDFSCPKCDGDGVIEDRTRKSDKVQIRKIERGY